MYEGVHLLSVAATEKFKTAKAETGDVLDTIELERSQRQTA